MHKRKCDFATCTLPARARGLCSGHYQQMFAGQTLRPLQSRPAIERFWSNVSKTETCWNWIGGTNSRGYGRFRADGTYQYAHRYSYTQAVGPIGAGLDIDHLCRNTLCVNPAHLEAVTHRENILRGRSIPAQNASKTHCKHGHEFSPENTYPADGGRGCLTCRRERDRRRAPRRRSQHANRG